MSGTDVARAELDLLHLDVASVAGGPDAVAARVTAAAPDLACLHGVATGFRWRQACADLARRCGLVVVGGGRPSGGVLVLSTLGVDVLLVREEPFGTRTGAVLASMRHRGAPFVLAAAHVASVAERDRLTALATSLVPGVTDIRYSVSGL